ncbi:MAG: T9SS type A sorting domain-containing protein [Chitinophagaceae bacterium]|nr:T9SS type A sorting domain-containing protein [Chitinophagaceae bacterium]
MIQNQKRKIYSQINLRKTFSFLAVLVSFLAISIQTSFGQYQKTQKAVNYNVHSNIGGFYESLPVDYASNPTKKYPLIIFLHGVGELGNGTTQLSLVLKNAIPKQLNAGTFPSSFTVGGEKFSFIVISPQFKVSSDMVNAIQAMIDYCTKHYRVDASRIYLTGLSLGGKRTWDFPASTLDRAGMLAAIVPVCSGATGTATQITNVTQAKLPMWFLNNSGDPYISATKAQDLVNAVNAKMVSPKAKITIHNQSGHDAWTKSYDPNFREGGMNVYEWMLSYKRGDSQTPPPASPIVNVGSDQVITLPSNSVTLDGSKSAAGSGTITSYAWSKVSGPAATITSPASAKTTVTSMQAGSYQFKLTVKNSNGISASANVTVTVNEAAISLQSNAGPNMTITLPASSVTVDGVNSTYPAGSTFKWEKRDGPAGGTITNPTSLKTTITGLSNVGDYRFQLQITDKNVNISGSSMHVIVQDAPQSNDPLQSNAGPNKTITLPTSSVTVDGVNSTYPAGSTFKWEKRDGPAGGTITNPTSLKTTITGLSNAGDYRFQLQITDKNGNFSATSMHVIVKEAPGNVGNTPLHADAGPNQTITLPETEIKLNGSANSTAPEGSTHTWSQTAGPVTAKIAAPWSIGTNVTGLTKAGTYQFKLELKDKDGNTDAASMYVYVKSAESTPVIPLHADAGPNQTITLPVTTVKLNGSQNSTAPIGSTHTWSQSTGPVQAKIAAPWSIGTDVTGLTVTGDYAFRLLLRDADGNEDVSYVTITVKSAASARTMGSSASNNTQSQPVQAATPDILTSSTELEVKINPNPVQSNMNIWISGKPSGKASVKLYNLSGQVLLQQDFVKSGAGTVNKSFNVSKLSPGTYIAQIIVDNQFKKTVKFLKQ